MNSERRRSVVVVVVGGHTARPPTLQKPRVIAADVASASDH